MRILLSLLFLLVCTPSHAQRSAAAVFEIAAPSIATVRTDNGKLGSAVAYYSLGETATAFLTNCHTLVGAKEFTLGLRGRRASGTFLLGLKNADLCLVGAELKLPIVEARNYFDLIVGEEVFAIGSPRGLELSITPGIVSQMRGGLLDPPLLIQTSAPISPGSSGGGLFDVRGRLVGITTYFLKESQSLNFAVSPNMVNTLSRTADIRSLDQLNGN